MTASIAGLSEIAERYDVLLCDVWGVIHDGVEAFAEPCAALARWRRDRGPVVLISNSPRPSGAVADQMDAVGVPREAWSALVTSGDVTRDLLAARAPGPAWRIGPERDDPLFEGLGLAFAGPGEAAFIACSGPNDDEVETPEDYRRPLTLAAARGIDMICANPDLVVQRGAKLIYCGGALARLYVDLGGVAVMAGKPHAPIYDLCLAKATDLLGGGLARERVLAIGDAVATDVLGARGRGLDVLFIAAGIHGEAVVKPDGGLDGQAVERLLARDGMAVDYIMTGLAW
ncbi:MAG: TIGR01459 family HAD-type hydrolase [Caulobacteraceae bacterium]|nr:TIGR01459 family HAD-type hydrolase [Caulobacteraceae bacterium]